MDIFEHQAQLTAEGSKPLAERMRPLRLNEFAGQRHLLGAGTLIRTALEQDRIFSMILWGPPGCGKTTLARMMAQETRAHFTHFSAVLSGVKEIRAVIGVAQDQQRLHRRKTILFVDEIHRFNKAQQDAFLHHVESGLLTLIGATTENPSFEVISPLLSRCRVVVLHPLTENEIGAILDRALHDAHRGLGALRLKLEPEARSHLIRLSGGDARVALNNLEAVVALRTPPSSDTASKEPLVITTRDAEAALQKKVLVYDKTGEEHYNLISAFHKSLRGSDPDAALYWLARMLDAGEDPLYVARRMVRFASEDVGIADPQALVMALHAMEAFKFVGHPEGELALAQAATYLATAPKSNRLYAAFGRVKETIERTGSLPVPHHIRNAPTRLMKSLGYAKGYKYAHDFEDAFAPQAYLPQALEDRFFYFPSDRGHEKIIKQRLERWRKLKNRPPNRPLNPDAPDQK